MKELLNINGLMLVIQNAMSVVMKEKLSMFMQATNPNIVLFVDTNVNCLNNEKGSGSISDPFSFKICCTTIKLSNQ
jgi:hypothetical protein